MALVKDKSSSGELRHLPIGAFTVDAQGCVICSTVPHVVPEAVTQEIGQCVVALFQGAREANFSFSEMVAQYATYKITAREMRGGAIIFLSPKAPQWVLPS